MNGARSVVMRDVASLVPYVGNARVHSADQVAKIAASIRRFGFNNPVLVDAAGVIVAGHGRVLAAKSLGLAAIPVVELGHLTDAERRAYTIADNRIAEGSTWDDGVLARELAALTIGAERELAGLTGFDQGELEKMLASLAGDGSGDAGGAKRQRSAPAIVRKVGDPPAPRILIGDNREVLKTLPDASVHCCVTSPPYWGLRDYGTAKWEGGDPACDHVEREPSRGSSTLTSAGVAQTDQGAAYQAQRRQFRDRCGKCGAVRVDRQIGLEATPDEFVATMVDLFHEVRRVLRPEGTLWLNLGDSYATGAGKAINPGGGEASLGNNRKAAGAHPQSQPNRMPIAGLKPKDLAGIPWRVAFALQADGWWLRQEIIWAKPNPMPESVGDRFTKSHEHIFLLAKSEDYYFDQAAILEPVSAGTVARLSQPGLPDQRGSDRVPGKTNGPMRAVSRSGNTARKPASARGIPGGEGTASGVPWEGSTRNRRDVWTVTTKPFKEAHFATYPPDLIEPCILAGCPEGGIVLDPFGGAGTTALVADRLKRGAILIELNPEYAAMAERRIAAGYAAAFEADETAPAAEAAE